MYTYDNKSFLQLKIIWKDDHMVELSVTATNGRYLGTTEVYDISQSLEDFAKSLVGYPGKEKVLFFEAGQKNGYSYFGVKIYLINNSGHVGVEVNLEENKSEHNSRQAEKDKVKLEIIVEPSAIDNFQRELMQLAMKEEGTATLFGRN